MPGAWRSDAFPRSRDATLRPSFAARFKKALPHCSLVRREGSAAWRVHWKPHPRSRRTKACIGRGEHHRPAPQTLRDPQSAGALALRRSTAVMRRRFYPPTRPGPRFLELPGANGRTLPGASAASTSQSDHAPDGTMPKAARIGSDEPPLRVPLPPHQPASPVDVPDQAGWSGDNRAPTKCQCNSDICHITSL
jgi:hypothetical protein